MGVILDLSYKRKNKSSGGLRTGRCGEYLDRIGHNRRLERTEKRKAS
jgi:hypothetical protein